MNNEIKVILFDLGHVLMNIDFNAFPNSLGLTTTEKRAQYDEFRIQQYVHEYETGKLSTGQFLDSLYESFNKNFSRKKILDAFNEIVVDDNQEIVPFVQQVKEKYRIAILSNTSPCHWEKVMRVSSVVKLFPDAFTSFQLGAMKPEKIVYEKVCSSLNTLPHEVLFIDDLKVNVDGAIAVGMKGAVFISNDQLEKTFTMITRKNKFLK